MNNFVERYRSAGQPATGAITVHASVAPAVGDTVTIGGQVYTFGTDFIGHDPMGVARSLAATINADPDTALNPVPDTQPIKLYYAIFYGRLVRLVATAGGVGGNSVALVTSNAMVFILSGATLTGGTAAA